MSTAPDRQRDAAAPAVPPAPKAFAIARVLIVLAGAGVGDLLGGVAGLMYSVSETSWLYWVGMALGGVGGMAAGLVWCGAILPRANRAWQDRARRGTLVVRGMVWGLYVGVGCTAVLHAGLALVSGRFDVNVLLIGLFFGVFAGLLTGVLCGVGLLIVAAVVRRPSC